MPSLCENIKTSYERLIKLTDEFTIKYSEAKESGELGELKRLRKDLETARYALLEHLAVFSVRDAKNPYHEALLEAGLDRAKTSEQENMRVDIRKEIQRQLVVYREAKGQSGEPCLEEWVRDITENQGMIYAEIAKDPAKIKERIKAGMIPIVMPSRSVQERTWKMSLPHLVPSRVKNGIEQDVYSAEIYVAQLGIMAMTREGFLRNIPDQPYLVWVNPAQESSQGPSRKAFEDQRAFYETLVRDYPNLYDPTDITPAEYIALQAVYSASIRRRFKERAGGSNQSMNLKPLDSGTRTRFLSEAMFAKGELSRVCFRIDQKRLRFDFDDGGVDDTSVFRPASRT